MNEKDLKTAVKNSLMELNQELTEISTEEQKLLTKLLLRFIRKVFKQLGMNYDGGTEEN